MEYIHEWNKIASNQEKKQPRHYFMSVFSRTVPNTTPQTHAKLFSSL